MLIPRYSSTAVVPSHFISFVVFSFNGVDIQVKLIDFSPGERFLVTYSSHEPSNPRDTHVKVSLVIFFKSSLNIIFIGE